MLEADMGLQAGIVHKISNAHLIFPDVDKQWNGTYNPGDNGISPSFLPLRSHTHVSPLLDRLPTAIASSNLQLSTIVDLDAAQAALVLSLSTNASATATWNNAPQPEADSELGGCVNVTTGLGVGAGADEGLFQLFNAGVAYRI
ncbi:hypothetical protein V8D89_009970 [Ganoderma adspersum]